LLQRTNVANNKSTAEHKIHKFKFKNLKKRLLDLSISLSIISLTLTLIINYQIAKEYLRVDGKTKVLFGIKELLQFSYQYYVVGIGLLSALLAIIGKSYGKSKKYIAIILSLIALKIVFLRIWQLFI